MCKFLVSTYRFIIIFKMPQRCSDSFVIWKMLFIRIFFFYICKSGVGESSVMGEAFKIVVDEEENPLVFFSFDYIFLWL